ncbi:hypothetical protein OLMES_4942 [Oleiphilus messinensis]|uniref:Uncharacterized protein n=1 Tax=Oleiphilus messinensis TaxID=141451 RepID=A0A1Y0IFA7_9GAMM|nr:hypothetical protein OLMES_4942 [Oleiphilus messinensis]
MFNQIDHLLLGCPEPHRVTQGFRRLFGDRRVLEKLNEKERNRYNQRINDLVQ